MATALALTATDSAAVSVSFGNPCASGSVTPMSRDAESWPSATCARLEATAVCCTGARDSARLPSLVGSTVKPDVVTGRVAGISASACAPCRASTVRGASACESPVTGDTTCGPAAVGVTIDAGSTTPAAMAIRLSATCGGAAGFAAVPLLVGCVCAACALSAALAVDVSACAGSASRARVGASAGSAAVSRDCRSAERAS